MHADARRNADRHAKHVALLYPRPARSSARRAAAMTSACPRPADLSMSASENKRNMIVDDRSNLSYSGAMPSATAPLSNATRDNILASGKRLMAGKGFSGVGLNEILATAGVPKGSFYHYFGSKDAFGEALLDAYFEDYLADIDKTLAKPGLNMARRLMNYFANWQESQSFLDCQGKCLAVKLGAEVADLSETLRSAMNRGTAAIVSRLAAAIEAGVAEKSLSVDDTPERVAQSLYQLWLGASVMAKIVRGPQPFDIAMVTTHQILHVPA